MNYIKYFILLLFTLGSSIAFSQNCSVNAGGNVTICGTTHTLAGSAGGNTNGVPTWTIVSKPAGAPDPVISDINSYTPNVTGLDYPGNYVFEISQPCVTGTVTSQVTITAPGSVATHTAGPDITNVSAVTGTVTLNGVIPPGYTGQWTAINIYNQQRFNQTNAQNATFSDPTSETTTFSLINKANHDVDPAYRVRLTITSIHNPNCSYVDEAIVRFVPNPEITITSPMNVCINPTNPEGSSTILFSGSSPKFATRQSDVAGNPAYGTTVTLNVVSQPTGGNISYVDISDNRIFLSGVSDVPGSYVFTITVSNSLGESYTTPNLIFNNNGAQPRFVSFLTASRPEQMAVYSFTGSGGEVHCASMAGTNTPITFLFTVDPADPSTVTTTVSNTGIAPPGGAPTIVVNGAGTYDRSATITPPAGGWSIGTYRFALSVSSGGCSTSQAYFIHISDGNRVDVGVDDITVCYPGSGSVTATVPLPDVYQQVVNSSYLQNFDGIYHFTTVSRPPGSAVPVFQTTDQRTLTHTSTTISNLNREGEYVFTIEARPRPGGVGAFLDQEYECSDASLKGTFSVFVSTQVNANAGSDQNITCPLGATITMNGNDPGVASNGEWTIESKPVGAPDLIFSDATLRNAEVSGFRPGTYTLRWTITTGDCVSFDETTITVSDLDCPAPGGVTGVDFWIKSDDAGDISTAWKDHSANLDDIPAVGDWTLSPADGNHNFHPYTTGYTNNRNFYNPESMLNPQPTGNTFGASDPMGHSIFSAVRPTTAANGRITGIDNESNTAAEPGISIRSNGLARHYEFLNTITSSDFSTPFNIGTTNVFSAIADNSVANGGSSSFSGGEKRLGLNGVYESFTFNNSNRFQLVNQNLRVGYGTHDVNGAFPGDIMEVIWYKRALTENEQSRVNTYLAVKNGVTLSEDYLSASSTVVFDQSTNAGYTNNIFGIARDDASALHQKQSRSVNNNQKLIIGAGTSLAETNADNTNDLSEGQFLMIGDNGLAQSLSVPLSYTAGSNGETNYRFAAIWKTQNTNGVGNVTVAWPKGIENLYLVSSTDDTFDTSDTFHPMTDEVTIGGVVYNTATVTLGNYFTFAGYAYAPGGVANGLSYWYRADVNADNTGVDTDVTGWTDVWSGTTVGQLGTNEFPKYREGAADYFNFNPGLNFTDATQSLGNITVQTVTNVDYDIFTFTKEGLGGHTYGRIFSGLGDNTLLSGSIHRWDGIGINYNNNIERATSTGTSWQMQLLEANSHFSTTIPSISYHKYSDTQTARGVNGAVLGTPLNFSAKGQIYGGHAFGDTRFSSNGSDNGGLVGHIGETIVYGAGNLTDIERRRVDSYLAIKYGITLGRVETEHYLSADESVVWDGNTNAGFNNNILGIAREDIGLFEQKQSRSVNNNQKLIIGAGTGLAETNSGNTNTLSNGQYLIIGDNGLTQALSVPLDYTSGSNGETNYRFAAIWKTQNTNGVGNVTVAWPKGIENLYLVSSTDDTFDTSDTFHPMTDEVTIGGVVYNTATVTLGNYFTFAGFQFSPGGVPSAAWYRADAAVFSDFGIMDANDGEAVSQWNEFNDKPFPLTQTTTGNRPTFSNATTMTNFNPTVSFNGGTKYLDYRPESYGNNYIIDRSEGALFGAGAANNNNGMFGFGQSATANEMNDPGLYRANNNLLLFTRKGSALTNDTDVSFPTTVSGNYYVGGGTWRNGAGTGTADRNNDLTVSLLGHRTTHNNNVYNVLLDATRNNFVVGRDADWTGLTGQQNEMIVFANKLDEIEMTKVESYLAIKWGMTLSKDVNRDYLDASGNVIWDGTANEDYYHNVFGVAREDIGAFEQKVSTSVNSGSILTVATINDFVSPNLDASRTGFANDQTYFILGDNNVVDTDSEIINIGGENYKRIKRTWLSQRHNTPGELFFQADLLSYGSDFSALNGVVMIIADDEDFTVNVRTIQGVHQVGKWIHSYDFNADASQQYITYGVMEEECLPEFVWSSPVVASGNTATGTIGGIGYTYTSSSNVLTSPYIFDNYNVFPASTDPSDIFSFPRSGHAVIRNTQVTSNTITFDAPVTDPILVFSSIGGPAGAVPVEFAQPMEVLWMDSPPGSWSVSWDSEYQITGHEGYAIVRIPGTHSSISFDYTAAENYANFLFGIAKERDCDKVPLIITNPMLRNRARQ